MSGEDAMYEMTVDLPTLPKGEPVQIVGLGTFENGSSFTVSKEEAERYRNHHAKQVEVRDEDTGDLLGSEVQQGPTLLQVADSMYGVTVSTASKGTKHKSSSKSTTSSDSDTSEPTPNTAMAEAETPTGDNPATSNQPKTKGGDN